jgi:hypothetical protein
MIKTIRPFTLRPGVTDAQIEALCAGRGPRRADPATGAPGSAAPGAPEFPKNFCDP